MGVMVLNPDRFTSLSLSPLYGVASRHVIWVEIISNQIGRNAEKAFIVGDARFKRFQRLVILHIPDVMAQESVGSFHQTKRVLQLRTCCQDLP